MSISIEDRIFRVADDILGLRLPMPPPLEWVNAWFLRDTTGWYIVDTGYNTPESREVLQAAIDHHLEGMPIIGVIVTHYHPDHVGQAGWLCKTFDCPLYMSPNEWLLARWLSTDTSESYKKVITNYYQQADTPQDILDVIADRGNSFLRTSDEVPAIVNRLEPGQVLNIGHRSWKVLIGRGHAPDMVLLHDEAGKFLISGDQIVSRITPNISIWAYDQGANPLADFLHSSKELPELVPNDVTVLPGHGRPFEDFHARIGTYIPFHENRLNKLRAGLTGEVQTLYELLKVLFPRDLTPRDYVFALGETHAHVNYLVFQGEMEQIKNSSKLDFRKI